MNDTLVITDKQQFLTVDMGDKVSYNRVEYTVIEIHKTREFAKFKICSSQQRVSQIILTM